MKKWFICATLVSLAGMVHAASCIVSGSIERTCASEAYGVVATLETRVTYANFFRLPFLEARFCSEEFEILESFNSNKPNTFFLKIH